MKKNDPIKSMTPSLGQKPHFFENEKLVTENTESFGLLKFFYKNPIGKKLRPLLTKKIVSELAGCYKSSRLSKCGIAAFIKKHALTMSEFEEPLGGYTTFNEFFCRKLKAGARSIDIHPNVVASPVDGKLFVIANISEQAEFFVKERLFNLEGFLKSKSLASEYTQGTLMIFRLAPYDYHRFHFPIDGVPSAYQELAGIYESVNPLAYFSGVQPLVENKRHLISIQTEVFNKVLMIPVGAMLVGKIVETYQPDNRVLKGDEAGYFAFGGSTVVLLFKQGMVKPLECMVKNSQQGIETAVKMGQPITE